MPIRILDVPDPFSRASRTRPEAAPLIQSDAYRQLVQEMKRYCNGELVGRSFLIAGHRGAGKTTLVASAFEAILREQRAQLFSPSAPPVVFRPLPVFLQGPTLLPSANEDLPLAMDGTGETGRRLSEMENVLVQITLGLHKALAREMVSAFRAHLALNADRWRGNLGDMHELVAQLELELDDYSGRSRLRDIWRRCDALESGVLQALGGRPVPGVIDPGLRELVGLASMSDAYRRISGRISRKDSSSAGATAKMSAGVEIDAKGKDISTALFTLLSGAAVTSGMLAGKVQAEYAALGGILTTLAGMVTAKISVSRTRDRAASLEDLFIPDLSVATMDRILPLLVDRLRDAGLAPVFIVDELDKVEGLSTRILGMIRRLKKLVAENAFFCFLADRSYYEEMRQRAANLPYSIEHTYFTHQMFIAFRHGDVRTYLSEVLERPPDPDPNDVRLTTQVKEEQADHAVLPYILVHNAQMHTIDLQRLLARMRDPDGNVVLRRGLVRSDPRYLLELLVQLAIELQLEQDMMQRELDRRPEFRRLAHDAMFFISRAWEQDDEDLSLADGSLEAFKDYLIGRMVLEKVTVPASPRYVRADTGQPFSIAEAPKPAAEAPRPQIISSEDLRFLFTSVRALAESLASPATIEAEYDKRGLPEVILSAVREAVKLGPLLSRTVPGPHTYRWTFRRSGRPVSTQPVIALTPLTLTPVAPSPVSPTPVPPTPVAPTPVVPPGAPPEPAPPAWVAQIRFIRDFEGRLKRLTNGLDPSALSAALGILPTSPAWPHVASAIGRLETLSAEKTTYPEMEDDVRVLDAYYGLLIVNIDSVGLSFYCGFILSNWFKFELRVGLALSLVRLSGLLRLSDSNPSLVRSSLTYLAADLDRILDEFKVIKTKPPFNQSPEDWVEWMSGLPTVLTFPPDVAQRVNWRQESGWTYWAETLRGAPINIDADMALSAIKLAEPFRVIRLPDNAMTLREWSVAFYRAMTEDSVPAWVATVALRRLGWDLRPGKFLEILSHHLKRPARLGFEHLVESLTWPGAGPPSRSSARVVIESQPEALSEAWKPETNCAAIILREEEWAGILKPWGEAKSIVLEALDAHLVALDLSAKKPALPSLRKRTLKPDFMTAGASQAFADFFIRPDTPPQPACIVSDAADIVPPGFRPVVRPKSVQDLFSHPQNQRMA